MDEIKLKRGGVEVTFKKVPEYFAVRLKQGTASVLVRMILIPIRFLKKTTMVLPARVWPLLRKTGREWWDWLPGAHLCLCACPGGLP